MAETVVTRVTYAGPTEVRVLVHQQKEEGLSLSFWNVLRQGLVLAPRMAQPQTCSMSLGGSDGQSLGTGLGLPDSCL